MKKNYVFFILLCSVAIIFAEQSGEVYSRSFMFTRPASASGALLRHLSCVSDYKKYEASGGFYGAVFGEKSRHSDAVDRYFLINGKNNLIVAGDGAPIAVRQVRDVRANWLGLPDNFSGILSMEPTQRQYGFFIGYHQELCAITDISFFQDSWIDIQLPITYVANDPHLTQADVVNAASQPFVAPVTAGNIIEAFNQPTWRYARIVGKRSRTLPADLRLIFGKTYMAEDAFEISYYSVFLLPISNTQNAKYFFDPVVGYNGHAGSGGGVHFQIPLMRSCEDQIVHALFMNLESIFLFHRKQKRTFDLRDKVTSVHKQWSRFLTFNYKKGPADQNIPGVNVLTLEVTSRPYGIADFSIGYRLLHENIKMEFCYGIWGHGDERVRFEKNAFDREFGIAGVGLGADDNLPATKSASTIDFLAPNDPAFVPITKFDIDRCSAAAASALLQRVQIALMINNADLAQSSMSVSAGGGFYAEFTHKNRPLPMIGGWLDIGLMF